MCVCVWGGGGVGGGGGVLSFFLHNRGLDPATVTPKHISNIRHTPNNIRNFSNPKNIPFLYIDLKKIP